MVAKYFHTFDIFQKSYFKESWRFAISYTSQIAHRLSLIGSVSLYKKKTLNII